MHYTKDSDTYTLHDCGVDYQGREVAIVFDSSTGTLIKHGDPEIVEQWVAEARERLRAGDFLAMANDIVEVRSSNWNVDTLNTLIGTTGAVLEWWNQGRPKDFIFAGEPIPPAGLAHVFKTPADCNCTKDTNSCPICDGGLAWCKVCGQAEVELEKFCPGPKPGKELLDESPI